MLLRINQTFALSTKKHTSVSNTHRVMKRNHKVMKRQYSLEKDKVVILGSGWAAYRMIKSLDMKKYDVQVVSPRNHFLFTPLLPSTSTGTLDFRSIIEPIRGIPRANFYQAKASSIDFNRQQIVCSENFEDEPRDFTLDYNKLIIAVGADNNTFGIPGVSENAFFLKELSHARALRKKIISNFERASIPNIGIDKVRELLHFVIVGGGPTGVEFAGEFADFFWEDLHRYFPNIPVNEVKITVLEASPQILNAFDRSLVKNAIRSITKRGVYVRTNSIVSRVEKNKVILEDGSEIRTGCILWSTGVGPRKLTASLDVPKTKSGRIVVDDHLRVKGMDNVYAVGDCACIDSNPLPATAQVAQQQGLYLANSLNNSSKDVGPFVFNFLGLMAYVGGRKSLMDSKFFKGSGFVSWLLWRSVYLTRLGSIKNKFQVPWGWMRTIIFGRDITNFD
eukprot:TRINITY_DN4179_c0_g1_i1.p1 TRINITY_DN4179_c0_g1~~TRINITY_DN4179_c0_g1_i1.p1  ORF type:complete len:456 (-),score=88.24 TRINITY_DN4179_c0_g1_i1:64-1410(-)